MTKEARGRERWGVRGMLSEVGQPFLTDTAVLRGESGACVYGCRRILHYSPTRICLFLGKRRITVRGEEMLCTSFCGGCVTVHGRVEGIFFCKHACADCKEADA